MSALTRWCFGTEIATLTAMASTPGRIFRNFSSHSRLLLLLMAYIYSAGLAQTTLISGETIQVSYTASKTEGGKKKDTWKIDVAVVTPAGDTYFEKEKTGNPITDMAGNRYVKISVKNHSGAFSSGDTYFTAEKANLVTGSTSTVYEIVGSRHEESFTIDVPAGAAPDVHAVVLAELKGVQYLPIVRASPEELSSGTEPLGRMFLVYKELDTLLLQRDRILRFMNAGNQPAETTYSNGTFIIRNNIPVSDSLTATLTYVDWNNRKTWARVKGDGFEISLTGTFADAAYTRDLKMTDNSGEKRIVRLEKAKKNVMVFNVPVAVSALPSSDNGAYSIAIGPDGSFQVRDNAAGKAIWSNMDFAAAPSGFTVAVANGTVTANLLFYKQGANGIAVRGAFMTIADDGHIRIFRQDGYAMWENKLAGR